MKSHFRCPSWNKTPMSVLPSFVSATELKHWEPRKPKSILMSFNRWLNLRKAGRSLTHLYPALLLWTECLQGIWREERLAGWVGGGQKRMEEVQSLAGGKDYFPRVNEQQGGRIEKVFDCGPYSFFCVLSRSCLLAQYHRATAWLAGVRALCHSYLPCSAITCW